MSINTIPTDSEWFEYLVDGEHLVDEIDHYGYKGQTTGDRIYHIPDTISDYCPEFPTELKGFWKVHMTWGDMCGELDHKDAVRVDRHEEVVEITEVTWTEV